MCIFIVATCVAFVTLNLNRQLTSPIKKPYKDMGCGYTCNRAVFSPHDDQILSDGILWDLRSGKHVHRFNKLNAKISGTFNPYSPEVIINSEVWDLRTNRLLKIVPQLSGTFPRFSPLGSVVMACPVLADVELSDTNSRSCALIDEHLGSSIQILDSRSYSSLYEWKFESSKTKVPRRKIYDFCIKKDEEKINVLEAEWTAPAETRRTSDVVAKWYAVGLLPDGEDSDQDDENPSEDDDEDDDDRSYGFDPTHSDDSGSTYMTPFNRADIPFDRVPNRRIDTPSQSDLDSSVGEDAFHEDEEEEEEDRGSSISQNMEDDSNDGYVDANGEHIANQPDQHQWEDLDDF